MLKPPIGIFIFLLSTALTLALGCFSGGKSSPEEPHPPGEEAHGATPGRPITIVIGNLTDLTGVSATALSPVNMALADVVRYYDSHGLASNAKMKVITFNGGFDASQNIPGYEWLKGHGANVLFTPIPSTAATLRSRVEADGMVLFTLAPSEKALEPPGRVFCIGGTFGRYMSYTVLDWIARNDPDFPRDRPARIGGAYWAEEYGEQILGGAEAYTAAHPDRYQWTKGYLVPPLTWTWGAQIEDLRICDYVFVPVPMQTFVKEFRLTDSRAKFIGTDAHLAFLRLIDDADLWDEVDGMLIVNPPQWWNEEGPMIERVKRILEENHSPGEVKAIMEMGNGYLAATPIIGMIEIIAEAVRTAGPENLGLDALYQSAISFEMGDEGRVCHSFNESKRTAVDCLGIYELSAERRDLARKDPAWIPVITVP